MSAHARAMMNGAVMTWPSTVNTHATMLATKAGTAAAGTASKAATTAASEATTTTAASAPTH